MCRPVMRIRPPQKNRNWWVKAVRCRLPLKNIAANIVTVFSISNSTQRYFY